MKKRILLIDDESIFRMLNEKIISITISDTEIAMASSGDEGLQLIQKGWNDTGTLPDVIFVDLDMPLMDGFGFVRAFQSLNIPGKEATTLVILTSSIDDKDRSRAMELQVKYFMSKPLAQEDVKRILG